MAVAQFNLAVLYLEGMGVAQDQEQGYMWMQKAADQGDPEALMEMALRYRDGIGTEVDDRLAFRYMKAAADAGMKDAFCNLGGMYRTGSGTRRNYKKAIYYFERSDKCAFALAHLGCLLLRGLGAPRDIPRALECLQRAARQKEPHALFHLGECYEKGWGVEKNLQQAVRLYQKADKLAPQGQAAEALCRLGLA